ncbi:MAG TPA: ABC transporter ATP-binding protein [Gaiellaceae bacterium]
MAEPPAIETRGLSKTYPNGVRALVDLDLRVERGEVFGYLGPNGAGKSTTIRLLLDLIRPTAGAAAILDFDTRADSTAARRHVGYLPGDLRLNDRLTGQEQLDSLARLRGGADADLRERLVRRFDCVLDRPIRELSKGNRQKLGIVQAVMHRPEVLILDEPTGGLDPINQSEFRSLARETAGEGRTVFLSSHSLEEVQRVADRVGIIRSGRLIDVDSVESLRERSLRRVTIRFAEPVDPTPFAAVEGVRLQSADGALLRLSAPEPAMDGIVKAAARHRVVDFVSEPADLEEIFLELYRENDGRG